MEAIILAGGLGTRLRSVVNDKPKALSLVSGEPFLKYVLDYLQREGVTDFIFSLGYLSEQVLNFLATDYPGLKYKYYIEESPLGTGGALAKAISLTNTENVLIVNADTFFEVNLAKMVEEHIAVSADCSISLKEMYRFDRYGSVELDENNRIVSFKEKSFKERGLINGGYLLLKKEVFIKELKTLPEVFSFEKDFLEIQLTKLIVHGFVSNSYFIDIGIPEDYEKAQTDFKK